MIKYQHLFLPTAGGETALINFASFYLFYYSLLNINKLPSASFCGVAETACIKLRNNSFPFHYLKKIATFKAITTACTILVVFPFNKQY